MPNATDLTARFIDLVCLSIGVEMAYWLFWMVKITGAFHTAAKLSPSLKSPSEVPPSPMNVKTDSSFFWYFNE